MDLPSLNAILRVNGFTPHSSPEEIGKALLQCGYKESEIPVALAILSGKESPTKAPVATMEEASGVHLTQTTSHLENTTSLFGGRIAVRQFWLAHLYLLGIFLAILLVLAVTALPLFSIISGISLAHFPDLSIAPTKILILFCIGTVLILIPFCFLSTLLTSLHIRRFHDLDLSGAVWMGVISVDIVLLLFAHGIPMFEIPGIILVLVITLGIFSWPGSVRENNYDRVTIYPSILGALLGTQQESGSKSRLLKRIIVPLFFLELYAIIFTIGVQLIFPLLLPGTPQS